MPILYYRILFFSGIPIAGFLLYKGIRLMRRSFAGKVLVEAPFEVPETPFEITQAGIYAIWVQGLLYKRNPLDQLRPVVLNAQTGEAADLSKSVFSPRSTGFTTGRMELGTFSAEPGNYKLRIVEGTDLSLIQQAIGSVLPAGTPDLKKFRIQVRQSQSQWWVLLALPMMIAGGCGIIFCFVFGLLADKLINVPPPAIPVYQQAPGATGKYTPAFLEAAHQKCASNKKEILSGNVAGCFYCKAVFNPVEITEWLPVGDGTETALCPKCITNAVLPSQFPVTDTAFLSEMNRYYFQVHAGNSSTRRSLCYLYS